MIGIVDRVEVLDILKGLRRRRPGEKLDIVCDNFSPHRHPAVHVWCADNQVELVFLPTFGSWLNWIEAEFAALRYFALNTFRCRPQPPDGHRPAAGDGRVDELGPVATDAMVAAVGGAVVAFAGVMGGRWPPRPCCPGTAGLGLSNQDLVVCNPGRSRSW